MPLLSDHIRAEHRGIEPHIDAILTTADAVGVVPRQILIDMIAGVLDFLQHELLPHAEQEDAAVYLAVEKAIGAAGSTNSMKREHIGIKAFVDELSDIHGVIVSKTAISDETICDLRRVLYGIHALISMHLTVEEDVYLPLLDTLPEETQHEFMAAIEGNGNH